VLDAENRLLGAIPRVTLLAALGNVPTTTSELDTIDPAPSVSVETITETLRVTAPNSSTEGTLV